MVLEKGYKNLLIWIVIENDAASRLEHEYICEYRREKHWG
jgi:hypothetical protein